MELFTLGPVNDVRAPRTTREDDVQQLAKALTGWQINDADPNAASSFSHEPLVLGPEVAFGKYGNWQRRDVVALVLGQPNHAPFIVRKLWGEFMPTPPPTADAAGSRDRLHVERPAAQAAPAQDPHPSRSCSSRSTSRTC